MQTAKCKICRRLGTKLFLRGERCSSVKCALIKKAYPPGPRKKRRGSPLSEYGKELQEKQKLKRWYNLAEKQFKNYVKAILNKKNNVGDPSELLIVELETRLDNVVFRFGFAESRPAARQMVAHGLIAVNGKNMKAPSYQVKKKDVISISKSKINKPIFKEIKSLLKKQTVPTWLSLDIEKLEGRIVGAPTLKEAMPPIEVSAIFEFYSR